MLTADALTRVIIPDPRDANDRRARMRAWMSTAPFDRIGMHPIRRVRSAGRLLWQFALLGDGARLCALRLSLIRATASGNVIRVLPEGWVDFARTPGPAQNTDTYGAQWWLMAAHGPGRPSRSLLTNPALANAFAAEGHEGQLYRGRAVEGSGHGAARPL